MVIAEVRRFVDREVIPIAQDLEQHDIYPVELIDKLKGLGVFAATSKER
jgi:alkylation response protein AidB-like acyl-CoA dehydrogenase